MGGHKRQEPRLVTARPLCFSLTHSTHYNHCPQCTFIGLLRVMAEVKGLIRICREVNVLPGGMPRAVSNQEMVYFFYRLR